MRVLWIVLMLTLLPLRGWVGDAMATGMAVAELNGVGYVQIAMHSGATEATKSTAKVGFDAKNTSNHAEVALSDCAGHMAAGHADTDNVDAGHCTPCSACGACHSASMSNTALVGFPPTHGSVQAVVSADAFFSADDAAAQKPPIS